MIAFVLARLLGVVVHSLQVYVFGGKAVGIYVRSFGLVRVGTHCLSVVLHDQLGIKFS